MSHLALWLQLVIFIPYCLVCLAINGWSTRHPDWGYYWFGAWMLFGVGAAAFFLARGSWGDVGWAMFVAVVNFIAWWDCRKRRKRKRAAELAGYKAKAIAEKIAAKQRETAQRRPVLSPIPEQQ